MFRRILPGFHPEAEMSGYLTEHGFTNSPPLLGEILRIGADGTRHTLGVLQGFVRNQGDAWAWMLEELSHAIDDLRPARHEERGQEEHLAPYEAFAAAIGMRLAQMHAVLAQPSDDPAFAPGTADAAEAEAWTARAERLLTAAFEAIGNRPAWDSDADAAAAKALLARQKPLLGAVKRLAQRARNVPITRIHGDFHLGQVLVANGDAYIIDFEGEPNRPVAERRAKASPLRDVAGMLRSFDYAAAMTERKGQASQAHVAEVARQRLVEEFRRRIPEAFLAAYDAVGGTRSAAQQAALDLFLIEKAAYEIGYEAASRPAWIRVPLIGLNALADGLLQEAKHG
jgi:maltose alpha-D-glucosyltransferase/alpha-amylase